MCVENLFLFHDTSRVLSSLSMMDKKEFAEKLGSNTWISKPKQKKENINFLRDDHDSLPLNTHAILLVNVSDVKDVFSWEANPASTANYKSCLTKWVRRVPVTMSSEARKTTDRNWRRREIRRERRRMEQEQEVFENQMKEKEKHEGDASNVIYFYLLYNSLLSLV